MEKFWSCLFAVCLLSGLGLAQVKSTFQLKCDKPSDQHNIEVGDKPGHTYFVAQISCTPISGDLDGAKRKSGSATEFLEFRGDKFTGRGDYIETMENGDKNFYTYQVKGTAKGGVLDGIDTWSMREGTGKLKGAKGSGTCKGTGSPDGTVTFDCAGEYTMAQK